MKIKHSWRTLPGHSLLKIEDMEEAFVPKDDEEYTDFVCLGDLRYYMPKFIALAKAVKNITEWKDIEYNGVVYPGGISNDEDYENAASELLKEKLKDLEE